MIFDDSGQYYLNSERGESMFRFNAPASKRNKLQSHRSDRTRFGRSRRNLILLIAMAGLLGSLTLLKFSRPASADTTTPVSISSFGTAVTQNFDSLVSSGSGTLPGNTPEGWGFSESGTNANTSYTAGTG